MNAAPWCPGAPPPSLRPTMSSPQLRTGTCAHATPPPATAPSRGCAVSSSTLRWSRPDTRTAPAPLARVSPSPQVSVQQALIAHSIPCRPCDDFVCVCAQVPASLMASHSCTTALTGRRCCRGHPGQPLSTTTATLNQTVETRCTATVRVPPAPFRVSIVAEFTISPSKPQMAHATAPPVAPCSLKQVQTLARLGFSLRC